MLRRLLVVPRAAASPISSSSAIAAVVPAASTVSSSSSSRCFPALSLVLRPTRVCLCVLCRAPPTVKSRHAGGMSAPVASLKGKTTLPTSIEGGGMTNGNDGFAAKAHSDTGSASDNTGCPLGSQERSEHDLCVEAEHLADHHISAVLKASKKGATGGAVPKSRGSASGPDPLHPSPTCPDDCIHEGKASPSAVPHHTVGHHAIPHPRVRALYKELITLAYYHPTFTLDKCRGKIKEAFRRNENVAVYVDGRGYEGAEAAAEGNSDDALYDDEESNASPFHEAHAYSAAQAGNKSDGSSSTTTAKHVGNSTAVASTASSPSVNGASASASDDSPINGIRGARGFSPDFMKALAWGRYARKDLEALINLHKYRAMRARYDWSVLNEEEVVDGRRGPIGGGVSDGNKMS